MLTILEPIPKGILLALGSVAVASVGLALFLSTAPAASPELLQNVALIGASLLLGYIVEAVWLAHRVEEDDDYEEWLGFVTGAGIGGFIGIAVALLTAQHLAAGHDSFLDDLGTSWAAVSQVILGIALVLQPLLAHRFGDPERD